MRVSAKNNTFEAIAQINHYQNTIVTNQNETYDNLCEMKFTILTELERHEHNQSVSRPFECDQCEMRFTQSSDLTRHRRIHSRIEAVCM